MSQRRLESGKAECHILVHSKIQKCPPKEIEAFGCKPQNHLYLVEAKRKIITDIVKCTLFPETEPMNEAQKPYSPEENPNGTPDPSQISVCGPEDEAPEPPSADTARDSEHSVLTIGH